MFVCFEYVGVVVLVCLDVYYQVVVLRCRGFRIVPFLLFGEYNRIMGLR